MGKLGNTGTVGEHHHKLLIVNHMLPHVRADSLDQDIRLRLTGIAHLFDGDLAFLLYHVRVDHQHVEHMTVGVLRPCVRQDVILRPPVLTFELYTLTRETTAMRRWDTCLAHSLSSGRIMPSDSLRFFSYVIVF